MRVDGGKALTSRGHKTYYGAFKMNRKFEQDGLAYYSEKADQFSKAIGLTKKEDPKPFGDSFALNDWVENRQTSYWSNRSQDAHSRVMQGYASHQSQANDNEAKERLSLGGILNPKIA